MIVTTILVLSTLGSIVCIVTLVCLIGHRAQQKRARQRDAEPVQSINVLEYGAVGVAQCTPSRITRTQMFKEIEEMHQMAWNSAHDPEPINVTHEYEEIKLQQ